MSLSSSIDNLRTNLAELNSQKFIRVIGIILVPIVVGYFIYKNATEKISQLEKEQDKILNSLSKSVEKNKKSDDKSIKELRDSHTYLIYSQKNNLLGQLNTSVTNLKFLITKQDVIPEDLLQQISEALTLTNTHLKYVKQYNVTFVANEKKTYVSLWEQSSVPLDDEQLTAIITDDKHNLVVAGAGSGKTEVLITRVAYLIKRKFSKIKPERILVLAFQRKAAEEVSERLKKRFKVDVKVKTFHSLGKEILEKNAKTKRSKIPQLMFNGDNFEREYSQYIKKLIIEFQEDKEFQNQIINYMKYYADETVLKEKADFQTKEEYYKYMKELRYTALDGTKVKSEAEREILNFFITHNLNGKKINVLYEHPAEWMDKEGNKQSPRPDFFFPDFNLYLEHWALDKKGNVPEWFEGDNPTEEYKKGMEFKKGQFENQEKFKLIETSSWEYSQKDFVKKLQKRFLDAIEDEEKVISTVSYKDLVNKVWEECRENVKALALNVGRYIVIAKTYSLKSSDIKRRLEKENWSRKQISFTEIALKVYEEYENKLRREKKIDFGDMINIAVEDLHKNKKLCAEEFDHILIDEYQDVSTQRYNLIKSLMDKNSECKLFCVGDDWQSIMGFAGSNLDFFVKFQEYFDHPARTDLSINYRSAKSIVDTGAQIIKHNGDAQLQKKTIAFNKDVKDVKVYYLLHQKEYKNNYYQQMTQHCVLKIKEMMENGYKKEDFMILARIVNSPKLRDNLLNFAKAQNVPISIESYNRGAIPFMSVHRSKGLQAKVVFVLNVVKDLYGFPCELENPDIFETAIEGKKKDRLEEERRLFYVAVTRAKEEAYIYTQKCAESKFTKEINSLADAEELSY